MLTLNVDPTQETTAKHAFAKWSPHTGTSDVIIFVCGMSKPDFVIKNACRHLKWKKCAHEAFDYLP